MGKSKWIYYIYAPPFNENIGGIIALHKLCDLINHNGEQAFLVPFVQKPILSDRKTVFEKLKFPLAMMKFIIKKITMSYETHNLLLTPVVKKSEIIYSKAIVIYPEIVCGNPLNVKNVVRWLLHKPGFHKTEVNYGEKDIYFFYQIIFNDEKLNPHKDHLLTVTMIRDDIYKQTNFGKREGSCYMIRKGKNRIIVHDLKNSILLDGRSHREIARIMNKCEYFISYDMETMYSQYAVLCGCKSVVIPLEGVRKDEWQPKKEYQYGIAYGFNDIHESEKTKHLTYEMMKREEKKSNDSVKEFLSKTKNIFESRL